MPSLSTIFATVVGVLLLVCFVLGIIIHVQSGKIDTLESKLGSLQAANAQLDEAVKTQDAAVDKLKADQDALTVAAIKATQDAARRDAPIGTAIDALKVAKQSGDACASADSLFNHYIGVK